MFPHLIFVLKANLGGRKARGDKKMKKKFLAILLSCLNILPAFAYVRDDTNTGGGFFGAIISIAAIIFIFWFFGDKD